MANDTGSFILDALLSGSRVVRDGGVDKPLRTALNFIGFTIADNAPTDATDITVGVQYSAVRAALALADAPVDFNEQDLVGLGDLYPGADNSYEVGSDALRWKRVRAVLIQSEDIVMRRDDAPDGGAHWTLREYADHLAALNHRTGQWYRLLMLPIDPPADAGTVEK